MNGRQLILLAQALYLSMSISWFLMAETQWSTIVAVVTSLPLLVALIFLRRFKPVAYFYAALLSMLYVATAITQIVIGAAGQGAALTILGCGLAYMMLLKFVLRALHGKI